VMACEPVEPLETHAYAATWSFGKLDPRVANRVRLSPHRKTRALLMSTREGHLAIPVTLRTTGWSVTMAD